MLRLVCHEGKALRRHRVAVQVDLLIEVEGAGQVLQVDNVGQVALSEAQDANPSRDRVPARALRSGQVRVG